MNFLALIVPALVLLLVFSYVGWFLIKRAVKNGVIEAFEEIEEQKKKEKKTEQTN